MTALCRPAEHVVDTIGGEVAQTPLLFIPGPSQKETILGSCMHLTATTRLFSSTHQTRAKDYVPNWDNAPDIFFLFLAVLACSGAIPRRRLR